MVVEEIIAAVIPGLNTRVVDSVDQLQQIEPAEVDLVVSDLVLPNSKPAEVYVHVVNMACRLEKFQFFFNYL